MGKRIFWIFILFVFTSSIAAGVFIHSESFAKIVKERLQVRMTQDMGLRPDFERLSIGIFPPSVSVVSPKIEVVQPNNALGLQNGTVLKAEKLGFSFRMLQAFGRGIKINKLFLVGADLDLDLPRSQKKGAKSEKISDLVHQEIAVNLSKSFYVNIRQLEVSNTTLKLRLRDEKDSHVNIKNIQYLALTPSREGTNVVANLEDIDVSLPSFRESLKGLKLNLDARKNSVKIDSIDVQRREAALHGSGRLVGDINDPQNLRFDMDVLVRANASDIKDFVPKFSQVSLDVEAEAKVIGTVARPAVQGSLKARNIHYSLWDLDMLSVAGSYADNTIVLDSIEAATKGGRIKSKSKIEMALPLESMEKSLEIQFDRVSFENFAGDLRKSVNNLKGIFTGRVGMKVSLAQGKSGSVVMDGMTLKPQLRVESLELNNQAYGKVRPYKSIFKLRPFQLDAVLKIKSKIFTIQDANFRFDSGVMTASGEIGPGGYNIKGGSDSINLGAEVGEISGIKLEGTGKFGIGVHGPADDIFIDFDVNQNNAKYVNFDFGSLNGRITYGDKDSYIYLKNLQGKKNNSSYLVNGSVSVGDTDDISVSAKFTDADPNDLFAIFAKQISKISWIPHGMAGLVSADVKVGGGYDKGLDSLDIAASVHGKKLGYKGEFFSEATVSAGVKKGTIFAKNLVAKKYGSELNGFIEYFPNDELVYELSAKKGRLRSLDLIATAGFPIDAALQFHSSGRGKWETLRSKTVLDLQSFFVRSKPMPSVSFLLETFPDKTEAKASIGEPGERNVQFALTNYYGASESTMHISADDAEMGYLLCLVNRKTCADPALQFKLGMEAKFHWKGRNWESMSGAGMVKELLLSKSGFQLKNKNVAEIRADNGLLKVFPITLSGDDSNVTLSSETNFPNERIDWRVDGVSSMKLLEFVNPLIDEAKGKLEFAANVSGTIESPVFSGSINFLNGFLRLSGLDAPVENMVGKVLFRGTRAIMSGINGQIGGGSAQVSGGIDLYLNKPPRFALDLVLLNNRLKFFPVNYAEFEEAKLSFTGDAPPYILSGTAKVRKVMMRSNFNLNNGQKALTNARYLPEKLSGARSFYEIKIKAVAESGVFVQNDLLDAEFKGELTLLNNFEFPQVVARAELVKGKLMFRSTPFVLDHAYIRAPTPEVFNPQFSIGGEANVDSYKISLFASGTIDAPKITLSSSPALAQEDIISLLAFGFKGEEVKKISPGSASAITYSEVGSILLEQLRLSQDLQSKGVKLTVTPSISDNEANIIKPNSTPGAAAPKVYLQTQILKSLDASFGSTVGSTQGQELDASLEYKLGRKASLNAIYEQEPGIDATERRSSYGADLKFRWGFK